MCIVGWSFGGYAALMSAVRESKLYRCAVSIAGVSDLRALVLQDSRFFGGRIAGEYLVGDDRKELDAGSPLRAANRIEVPVLLVHGTDDIQVVIDHSRKMAQALAREHKPHELVVIDGGDHALHRAAWRLTLYNKLEGFLAEHIGAAAGSRDRRRGDGALKEWRTHRDARPEPHHVLGRRRGAGRAMV